METKLLLFQPCNIIFKLDFSVDCTITDPSHSTEKLLLFTSSFFLSLSMEFGPDKRKIGAKRKKTLIEKSPMLYARDHNGGEWNNSVGDPLIFRSPDHWNTIVRGLE